MRSSAFITQCLSLACATTLVPKSLAADGPAFDATPIALHGNPLLDIELADLDGDGQARRYLVAPLTSVASAVADIRGR